MKETANIFISWFVCYKLTARSNVGGYEWNTWHIYKSICLLQTYCHLSTSENLSISWQLLETYGVINYGSGWRKDVSKCLEFNCLPTFSSSKKEMFAKNIQEKISSEMAFKCSIIMAEKGDTCNKWSLLDIYHVVFHEIWWLEHVCACLLLFQKNHAKFHILVTSFWKCNLG